jgi:hypothetical protein
MKRSGFLALLSALPFMGALVKLTMPTTSGGVTGWSGGVTGWHVWSNGRYVGWVPRLRDGWANEPFAKAVVRLVWKTPRFTPPWSPDA